jgi:hypothetical protein
MSSIPNRLNLLVLLYFWLSNLVTAQVVQRLTADRFTHYSYDDWISYLPALNITSVDMDESFIYFASSGGGILRYDKYENRWDFPFTTSNGLRSNRVKKIVYSAEDLWLYAQTNSGIDVYNPAERFWKPTDRTSLPPHHEPSESELEGINPDKEYRFPPYFRPPNSYLPDFYTGVNLIYNPGGIIYNRNNLEFKFTDRIVDSWQRLWIGSNGMGPLKADLYNQRLESIMSSIPYISTRDVFIQNDLMWIGGLNLDMEIEGICSWNRNDNTWQYFEARYIPQLYKDDVFAIDGNDRYLVFATIDGVAVFEIKKNKWITLNTQANLEGDRVSDVLVVGDTAYVATEFGFNWIDLNSLKVYDSRETVLDHVMIYQLAYKDNLVWAATRLGLYSIDVTQDKIVFYPSRAASVDYNLTAIEVAGDELWMANKNGIAWWDQKKDEWHSYPDLELKPYVRDIAFTKNCIWFATDLGVLKFDRARNYFRLFTEKDGLISRDTYHIDPENEFLWISTITGITRFRWFSEDRID